MNFINKLKSKRYNAVVYQAYLDLYIIVMVSC